MNRSKINKLFQDNNYKIKVDVDREKEFLEDDEDKVEAQSETEDDRARKDVPGISGIYTPYVYVGSNRSCFPVHIEDLNLYSINIHLYGEPRVWFIIRK